MDDKNGKGATEPCDLRLLLRRLAQHDDNLLRFRRGVERRLNSIDKTLEVIRRVAMHGDEPQLPWHRLPAPKMRQVEKVLACLNQHPSYNVSQAVHRIFADIKCPGGYRSAVALKAYCYAVKLALYTERPEK